MKDFFISLAASAGALCVLCAVALWLVQLRRKQWLRRRGGGQEVGRGRAQKKQTGRGARRGAGALALPTGSKRLQASSGTGGGGEVEGGTRRAPGAFSIENPLRAGR